MPRSDSSNIYLIYETYCIYTSVCFSFIRIDVFIVYYSSLHYKSYYVSFIYAFLLYVCIFIPSDYDKKAFYLLKDFLHNKCTSVLTVMLLLCNLMIIHRQTFIDKPFIDRPFIAFSGAPTIPLSTE